MTNPIDLPDPDRARLLQCLNEGVEPPAELAAKLFPSVCGSWDVKTLIHAEIPIVNAAIKHFPPPRRSLPRRKPNPEPKTHIGTLIPGEI